MWNTAGDDLGQKCSNDALPLTHCRAKEITACNARLKRECTEVHFCKLTL